MGRLGRRCVVHDFGRILWKSRTHSPRSAPRVKIGHGITSSDVCLLGAIGRPGREFPNSEKIPNLGRTNERKPKYNISLTTYLRKGRHSIGIWNLLILTALFRYGREFYQTRGICLNYSKMVTRGTSLLLGETSAYKWAQPPSPHPYSERRRY